MNQQVIHRPFGVLLALCVSFVLSACNSPTAEKPPEPGPAKAQADKSKSPFIVVEEVRVDSSGRGPLVTGRLSLRPQGLAAVSSPFAARVIQLLVKPGQMVEVGQTLVMLQSPDVASAKSALVQATSKAAQAEDMLRRQNEMIKKGVGLEVERFAAEQAAREAQAELQRARQLVGMIGAANGDQFALKAPKSGVVLAVKANVGSLVNPSGESLIELGDMTQQWVVADFPETDLKTVSVGQRAEISFPSMGIKTEGQVESLGQLMDSEQRRAPVYIQINMQAVKTVSSGMLAEIRMVQAGSSTGFSLPVAAVLLKGGAKRIVYVQKANGEFEARPVQTGPSRDGRVVITSGLQVGDKVVIKGALLIDSEAEQLL